MRFIIVAIGILAATALLSVQPGHNRVSASTDTGSQLVISPPSGTEHLTQAQAIAAAQAYAGGAFAPGRVATARFGSVDLRSLEQRDTAGALRSVGQPDAWIVTVQGLDMQRPAEDPHGVASGHVPPRIHSVSFVVDDQTGQVLEGVWY